MTTRLGYTYRQTNCISPKLRPNKQKIRHGWKNRAGVRYSDNAGLLARRRPRAHWLAAGRVHSGSPPAARTVAMNGLQSLHNTL
jgi:hypothetical protein